MPTKKHCEFVDWYEVVDDAGTLARNPFDFNIRLSRSITLQAKWRYTEFGDPDFILPAAIANIGENAFRGIQATTIEIPALPGSKPQSIGAYAFADCSRLEAIRIPKNCTIDEHAFDGCKEVTLFSTKSSPAETFAAKHDNRIFVEDK